MASQMRDPLPVGTRVALDPGYSRFADAAAVVLVAVGTHGAVGGATAG